MKRAVVFACALLVLTGPFGVWTSTSVASFFRFLLAFVILIVLPGLLITGFLRLRVEPLEQWMLALLLGMLSASSIYWITSWSPWPHLFWVWPVGVGALIVRWRRALREGLLDRMDPSHVLLATAIAATLAPLLAGPVSYWTLSLRPDGQMLRPMPDVEFHLAIVRELMHTVPPQTPFVAGIPLRYHYGADLTAALLARTAMLDPADVVVRFLPPVLLIQATLSVFCLARLWIGSGAVAALVAGLTVLGGDLTWVVGALCPGVSSWDFGVFQAPTFYSLYTANPMLPALGLLFGGLFALVKACRERRLAWVVVAVVLFAALMEFKVFTGLHAAVALAVTGIWARWRGLDLTLAKIAIPVGIVACGSLVMLGVGSQASLQVLRFAPLHLLETTADRVCFLPGTSAGAVWNPLTRLALLLGMVLPVYLIGSLGPRLLGSRALVAPLRQLKEDRPDPRLACSLFLTIFAVLGFLATAVFRLTQRDEPGSYNNSAWFLVQSKYLMWIFVGEALVAIRRRGRRPAFAAALLVSALSLPSTVAWMREAPDRTLLDAEQVSLMRLLGSLCRDGITALGPLPGGDEPEGPRDTGAELMSLAGCRVPLAGPFAHEFVSQAEWRRRQTDMFRFWNSWRKGRVRTEILDRYDARYVMARLDHVQGPFPGLPPIFVGSSYAVYPVSRRAIAPDGQ
ncbi:MAG TPA: hypothetical protein VN461_22750 [Vicinamibacteria bacterium]|nr:hypothetical protein [Vicinamibacteria bacterium]